MRGSLKGVRARVERLASQVARDGCKTCRVDEARPWITWEDELTPTSPLRSRRCKPAPSAVGRMRFSALCSAGRSRSLPRPRLQALLQRMNFPATKAE